MTNLRAGLYRRSRHRRGEPGHGRPKGPKWAVIERIDSASDISRRVFSAWASGTEATLRTTLEAQKAALDASVWVASTVAESERDALKRIADAAQRAQEAALEAFRASIRAVEEMSEGKTPVRPGR